MPPPTNPSDSKSADVVLEGINPCQRCIVPTRDSRTGEPSPDFAQIFRARRAETLPPWANRARFNHFYRLAVNTRAPSFGDR